MQTLPAALLLAAVASVAAMPLCAQTAPRRGEIPRAYTAVREADLRRDVEVMASRTAV